MITEERLRIALNGTEFDDPDEACGELMELLEETLKELAGQYCPEANGFEGPDTYPDCGHCPICTAKKLFPLEAI